MSLIIVYLTYFPEVRVYIHLDQVRISYHYFRIEVVNLDYILWALIIFY